MMDREEYIGILSGLRAPIRRRVEEAVMQILVLAEPYRGRGEGFSFADYPELDAEVNAVLRTLSERCRSIAREAMRKAEALMDYDDVDFEAIFDEVESEGEGALWAFDMHSSNLKRLMEGWIAVWFAGTLSRADIFSRILAHMDAPETARLWRDGIRAHLIDPGEFHFGKGYQRNIPNAMKVLAAWLVMKAVMLAMREDARARGKDAYIIHRGSRYDCPFCDSNCDIILPLDDWRLPQHPNCMCVPEFIKIRE